MLYVVFAVAVTALTLAWLKTRPARTRERRYRKGYRHE